MGELDIELGGLQQALGLHFGSAAPAGPEARWSTMESETAWLLVQGQAALELALASSALARASTTGHRPGRPPLRRDAVDHVEQVAGLDHRAVAKLDIGDEAPTRART